MQNFSLGVIRCVIPDLPGFCQAPAISEQRLGWMLLQQKRKDWEITSDFQNSKSLAA